MVTGWGTGEPHMAGHLGSSLGSWRWWRLRAGGLGIDGGQVWERIRRQNDLELMRAAVGKVDVFFHKDFLMLN